MFFQNIEINHFDKLTNIYSIAFNDSTLLDNFFMETTTLGGALNNFGSPTDWKGETMNYTYKQSVMAFSIDDFIKKYKKKVPNHLKIDVDGNENKILRGAVNTLKDKNLKSILVELDMNKKKQYNSTIKLLNDNDFYIDGIFESDLASTEYAGIKNHIFSRRNRNSVWLVDSPIQVSNKDFFVGPWSFKNKKYPKNYKFPFISDLNELKKLEKESNEIIDYLIQNIIDENNQHPKSNFRKFIKVIFKPWLNVLVHLVMLRGSSIDKIISRLNNKKVDVVLMKDDINWNFNDTYDFILNGSFNKEFNHWIMSRIIEFKKPKSWNFIYESKNDKYKKVIKKSSFKEKIYHSLIIYFPLYSVKGLDFKSSLKLSKIISKIKFKNKKIDVSEERLSKPKFYNIDFVNIYKSLIPKSLSNIKFKPKLSKKRNRFIVSCGSKLYYNEKYKLKIANQVASGDKLILAQHGGVYGSVAVHSSVNSIEYDFASKFITWGWEKNRYIDKTIKLPSPYLSKFNYRKENNKIIFVESNFDLFSTRINSINLNKENIERKNNLATLYKTIENKHLKNFYYRPPLSNLGGEDLNLEDKNNIINEIKIVKGDLHTETMKSKLVLIDGPNTTMNILFSANVPTIAFWDFDSNYFDDETKPYINKLVNHGVIQKSAFDAANKLNEIITDVDTWWYNKDIQNDLKIFNDKY